MTLDGRITDAMTVVAVGRLAILRAQSREAREAGEAGATE
jgi:hypothetical protein